MGWWVVTGNKQLRIERLGMAALGVWLHLTNIEIFTLDALTNNEA